MQVYFYITIFDKLLSIIRYMRSVQSLDTYNLVHCFFAVCAPDGLNARNSFICF